MWAPVHISQQECTTAIGVEVRRVADIGVKVELQHFEHEQSVGSSQSML